MKKWLLIGIIGSLLILGLVLLFFPLTNSGTKKPESKPQAGYLAPDFTLTDLQGKKVQLAKLRGKAVFLNFWATWCPPCREEMPLIEELYQKRGQEIQVVTVNLQEDQETVKSFLQRNGYNFSMLLDKQGQVANQYWIKGIPSTFIIDSQGVIQEVWVGALSRESLAAILQKVN